MSKQIKQAKEQESPILTRATRRSYWWLDLSPNPPVSWACHDELNKLFKVGSARRLVFVAKSRADATTYRVAIRWSNGAYGPIYCLTAPDEIQLTRKLGYWLQQQVAEGRPNIGVMILSGD